MIEPLASPFQNIFDDFGQSISQSCFLCSPYVTQMPVHALVKSFQARRIEETVQVHFLTDLSLSNIIQGSTDISALIYLQEHIANVRINYLPHVHAKVYIADGQRAIVGSANWTQGGAARNYEYALRVDDPLLISRIHEDMTRYASLGGEADPAHLRALQEQTIPLREAAREGQKALRRAVTAALQEQERAAQDSLIRIRVAGRTVNAIFSDTILYLLSRAPMTTVALNDLIRQIHPDLCDETTDRVIDGKHYGKLWKHQVRGAQVSLSRRGSIAYDRNTRIWSLFQENQQ